MLKSCVERSNTLHSLGDILDWVAERRNNLAVNVQRFRLTDDKFWFYDKQAGTVRNSKNCYFHIAGLQELQGGEVVYEQPILVQNDPGYLGLLCKEINGVLHFLMQGKAEPGNINIVQISPTLQATKGNFTRQHGGQQPAYLEYFTNKVNSRVLVDQLQSEQASRFYKKRNRNIIVYVEDDIEVLPSHKWMTLGQIKELLKIDNMVNMDTRTVISCIPYYQVEASAGLFTDNSMYKSLYNDTTVSLAEIYNEMNSYKMFDETEIKLVPLSKLETWDVSEEEIVCRQKADFKIIFCDIEIEGREVNKWSQPLVQPTGQANLGLFSTVENGVRKFLVQLTPEVGTFDKVEWGPTVHLEPSRMEEDQDNISSFFLDRRDKKQNIMYDVILSEEGGRFYHEANRYTIIEIDKHILPDLATSYKWVDYKTLNRLVQANNCLNIQLRSLMALLEV